MAVVKFLNTWGKSGGTIDLQRTDLYILDLSQVINYLKDLGNSDLTPTWADAFNDLTPLWPTLNQETMYWAKSVSIPTQTTEAVVFKQDGVQNRMPGMDMPAGEMHVEFYMDSCSVGGSKVLATLLGWERLRSAGQFNRYMAAPLLRTADDQPQFMFNLAVVMLQGSIDGKTLEPGTCWQLYDCWLQEVQTGEFSYSNSGENQVIKATIQVSSVWPINANDLGYEQHPLTTTSINGRLNFQAQYNPKNLEFTG